MSNKYGFHIFMNVKHEYAAKDNNTSTRYKRGVADDNMSKSLIAIAAVIACGTSISETEEERSIATI